MNTLTREPDLFDICAARHEGNAESAAANRRTNKSRDRARILAHLRTVPDATCEEVEIALNMGHQTCSARFSELKRDGEILAVEERRATRSGCLARAWRGKI